MDHYKRAASGATNPMVIFFPEKTKESIVTFEKSKIVY